MPLNEIDRAFLAGLAVLYVEDDPVIRAMTAEFLRRRVGRLITAEDGAEGLEVFRSERPDLILTDIMLPKLDGVAMTEAIKAEAPDVPVVVITAFEQTTFLLRSINAGVDRYVLKPVQPGQLEAALLHCAHQLRAEAELRQHIRVERELMQARQHEALSYLARGMAHDYNNLLQAILSTLEAAVGHTTPGSPAHLILGMTQRFTVSAQRLGQQLLSLSGEGDEMDGEGPLVPLLEEALRDSLADAGIEVTWHLSPDLPMVRFNQHRLNQALSSLLTNAREAMPEGGTLDLEVAPCEVGPEQLDLQLPPGTYLSVSLRDSGRGIPADQLPRIFDPYFSTKPTGTQKGQGLSLAVCRSILRAHGGQVMATSEPGKGSTFRLFLPVVRPSGA